MRTQTNQDDHSPCRPQGNGDHVGPSPIVPADPVLKVKVLHALTATIVPVADQAPLYHIGTHPAAASSVHPEAALAASALRLRNASQAVRNGPATFQTALPVTLDVVPVRALRAVVLCRALLAIRHQSRTLRTLLLLIDNKAVRTFAAGILVPALLAPRYYLPALRASAPDLEVARLAVHARIS